MLLSSNYAKKLAVLRYALAFCQASVTPEIFSFISVHDQRCKNAIVIIAPRMNSDTSQSKGLLVECCFALPARDDVSLQNDWDSQLASAKHLAMLPLAHLDHLPMLLQWDTYPL